MKEPALNKIEADSAVWQKVKSHLESRLDSLRRKNDSKKLNEIQTADLRGQISEVKLLLGLDKPPPAAEQDDSKFKD